MPLGAGECAVLAVALTPYIGSLRLRAPKGDELIWPTPTQWLGADVSRVHLTLETGIRTEHLTLEEARWIACRVDFRSATSNRQDSKGVSAVVIHT